MELKEPHVNLSGMTIVHVKVNLSSWKQTNQYAKANVPTFQPTSKKTRNAADPLIYISLQFVK
jgi:hypothetical protein